MAVPNDDLMRRRFALADMGRFPTSQKNARPRTGEDPPPAPYQPINPSDPATGGVVRTRNGQMNYGFLPLGERAPFQGTWGGRSTYTPPRSPYAPPPPPPGPGAAAGTVQTPPRGPIPAPPAAPTGPATGPTGTPLNANPVAGSGFGEIRARDAMLGADKPAPVQQAATGSAPAGGDLSARVGDERRALMSDYERVMRELVDLGARGRDTPEMQTRRDVLINARKAMESRLRDLAMATPRTNVVSPEDAKVARERLARTSGVDTRTPMERGITSIANRTMPGAGSVLGEATAMSADKMAFNERQMLRDARQAEGARRLTTALPGGEAPLAMMERERAEMRKRREDQVALEQATAERAIRNQQEGSPEERLAMAQAREAESRAGFNSTMTDIERQRMMREYDNPGSITNQTDRANRLNAGRVTAQTATGENTQSITELGNKALANLPASVGFSTDPVQYGADIDAFINNAVVAAENLAAAGDAVGAAKAANALLANEKLRPYRSLLDRAMEFGYSFNPLANAAMGGVNPIRSGRNLLDSRSSPMPATLQPHSQKLTDAIARLQRLANGQPSS